MAKPKKELATSHSEVRKFKMHPDLLFSVIKSQAGTAEKALLEAVMNAVDAGAKECRLIVDVKGYQVIDDGKGFSSRQEVDEFFETFGTPHKEGDAPYGRFRMGRGQLFAFSSTVWKTGSFEMHVDIKKTGLDYIFKENMPSTQGCTIIGKWYEKFSSQELFHLMSSLEGLIKYMQIPVYINDKLVSLDPEKQKWDYVEDKFFVKVMRNTNTLSVYNMGALVAHYPAHRFGVGGTVVTREALQVNFARNDILISQCKLWKKIEKKLNEIMGIEVTKKTVLSDAEREAILDKVLSKSVSLKDMLNKGILSDVSNKKITFKSLLATQNIAFSSGIYDNRRKEEIINESKSALVLSSNMLDKFKVKDGHEFVKVVQELIQYHNDNVQPIERHGRIIYSYSDKIYGSFNPTVLNIDELIENINNSYTTYSAKELTKQEQAFLNALKETNRFVLQALLQVKYKNKSYSWEESQQAFNKQLRSISLGHSELANAWTDGATYITFKRDLIHTNPSHLIYLMTHEYCHESATNATHDHGDEFYKLFHDVYVYASYHLDQAIITFQNFYNKEMLKAGLKPKKVFDNYQELSETHSDYCEGYKTVLENNL